MKMETAEQWCEVWEKNFDSNLKALNKFKDALKTRPSLTDITEKRCFIYLELLSAELEELKIKYNAMYATGEGSNRDFD